MGIQVPRSYPGLIHFVVRYPVSCPTKLFIPWYTSAVHVYDVIEGPSQIGTSPLKYIPLLHVETQDYEISCSTSCHTRHPQESTPVTLVADFAARCSSASVAW